MNNIDLSVCIATLNRGKFIGATLESIIRQANEQVEIIVLDGGSKDNTEQVIHQYQQSFPRLRYVRRDVNMGLDRDFDEAVELAQGDYCWLFTDDDLLKSGAIQTVLDAIKHAFSLVIINAEVRNADLSGMLQTKRLDVLENRIYKPAENERLFIDAADYLSFIGCVVIKRQLWKARNKEKYFGTLFVHVGVIFQSPLPEDTMVVARPLIQIRYGNAMWLRKSFEIWMFKWPQLIWSFPDFSELSKRRICPKEPWRRISKLLHQRANGTFTTKEQLEWLEPRIDSAWNRAVAKAIARFPGRIVNFLGIIYYRAAWRHPARKLALLDLGNSPFYCWRWRKHR